MASVLDKWDDEDSDDAPEEWDVSSDEEEEIAPAPKPVPKPVPKPKAQKKLKEKIQEKESNEKNLETEIERKLRLQTSVIESDLEAAKTLFGDAIVAAAQSNISLGDPKSREDFNQYAISLMGLHLKQHVASPHYSTLVEQLMREMIANLSVDETRKLSSTLTAILNEKQKAAKGGKGGKKKNTKATAVVGRGIDTTNYDDAYDEFDDFM